MQYALPHRFPHRWDDCQNQHFLESRLWSKFSDNPLSPVPTLRFCQSTKGLPLAAGNNDIGRGRPRTGRAKRLSLEMSSTLLCDSVVSRLRSSRARHWPRTAVTTHVVKPWTQGLDVVVMNGSLPRAHSVQSCLCDSGRRSLHPSRAWRFLHSRTGIMLLDYVVHVLEVDVVLHLINIKSHSFGLKKVINVLRTVVVTAARALRLWC